MASPAAGIRAQASSPPVWLLGVGIGLVVGADEGPTGVGLAVTVTDGAASEALAVGMFGAPVLAGAEVTVTLEHAASPTADSTTTSNAGHVLDAVRARPGGNADSRMIELLCPP